LQTRLFSKKEKIISTVIMTLKKTLKRKLIITSQKNEEFLLLEFKRTIVACFKCNITQLRMIRKVKNSTDIIMKILTTKEWKKC
jgi:hypothetical protein